jgi:hypothetical protein
MRTRAKICAMRHHPSESPLEPLMKFPVRLACFALLAVSTTALAAEWLPLLDGPGVRMSLNPSGRKTPDGRHVIQYRIDFKEAQKTPDGKTYKSSTVWAVIGCKQRTIAAVELAAHADEGGKGKEVMSQKIAKPEPKPVSGGSEELLWNAVCAPPKPAAAPPAPAPAKK